MTFICIFVDKNTEKSWICMRFQSDRPKIVNLHASSIRPFWALDRLTMSLVLQNRETLNLSILLTINIFSLWIIFPWWTVVDKNSKLVKIYDISKIELTETDLHAWILLTIQTQYLKHIWHIYDDYSYQTLIRILVGKNTQFSL